MYLIYIKKKHNILQLNIVLDEYCFLVSSRVQNSSTRKMPSAQKSSNTKQLPSIKKSRVLDKCRVVEKVDRVLELDSKNFPKSSTLLTLT